MQRHFGGVRLAHPGYLCKPREIVWFEVSRPGGGLFNEASHDSNRSQGRFVLMATIFAAVRQPAPSGTLFPLRSVRGYPAFYFLTHLAFV